MTNDEICYCLKYYQDLRQAIVSCKAEVELYGYRKKNVLIISSDIIAFVEIVEKLEQSIRDKEVSKIFELCYGLKLNDREVISKIHMSPSTFYRIKSKLCKKLLLLCAVNGLVSEKEILKIVVC